MSITPPRNPRFELRLFGLNKSVNDEQLASYFSNCATVFIIQLHPSHDGTQWAQMWVGSDAEVKACLSPYVRDSLMQRGITLVRAPVQAGYITPDSTPSVPIASYQAPRMTSPTLPRTLARHHTTFGGQSLALHRPLPRNLYVLNLPIELSEPEFECLFTPFGIVEHSMLLHELDDYGRRRGFILMSTHTEALEAMHTMSGKLLRGQKVDVSWALKPVNFAPRPQGVTRRRVVHPPASPVSRTTLVDRTVVVEGLDPFFFPNAGAIREIFAHFGSIADVQVISGPPYNVLIHFADPISATALVNSSGLFLGGGPITARRLKPQATSINTNTGISFHQQQQQQVRFKFDPFQDDQNSQQQPSSFTISLQSQLNANSRPFIPPIHLRDTSSNGTTNGTHESPTNDPRSGSDESHSTQSSSTDKTLGLPDLFDLNGPNKLNSSSKSFEYTCNPMPMKRAARWHKSTPWCTQLKQTLTHRMLNRQMPFTRRTPDKQ